VCNHDCHAQTETCLLPDGSVHRHSASSLPEGPAPCARRCCRALSCGPVRLRSLPTPHVSSRTERGPAPGSIALRRPCGWQASASNAFDAAAPASSVRAPPPDSPAVERRSEPRDRGKDCGRPLLTKGTATHQHTTSDGTQTKSLGCSSRRVQPRQAQNSPARGLRKYLSVPELVSPWRQGSPCTRGEPSSCCHCIAPALLPLGHRAKDGRLLRSRAALLLASSLSRRWLAPR
jgi:hypothetical protein